MKSISVYIIIFYLIYHRFALAQSLSQKHFELKVLGDLIYFIGLEIASPLKKFACHVGIIACLKLNFFNKRAKPKENNATYQQSNNKKSHPYKILEKKILTTGRRTRINTVKDSHYKSLLQMHFDENQIGFFNYSVVS